MNCSIYDLGKHPSCGIMKLPFPANSSGEYYIKASVGRSGFQLPLPEINSENAYFYLNGSHLPMLRDIEFEILKRQTNEVQKFNLERNIGTDCYPENVQKCFSKFRLFLEPIFGIENYEIQFPHASGGSANELLYYDIKFVNGNVYSFDYVIPDPMLYTTVSVNASIRVWVDGIKYYWNDDEQLFADQIIIDHVNKTITFKEDVNGGRVEFEFYDNLILR